MTIQDHTSEGDLYRLAGLLGLRVTCDTIPFPCVTVKDLSAPRCGTTICRTPRGLLEFCWSIEEKCFYLFASPEIFKDPASSIRLWRYTVICAGVASVLRGTACMLLHGAMLRFEDRAVLLLGESGIGKSTSAERWQRCGGSAPADDMLLLEAANGGFFAHAMPTWSRCLSAPEHPKLSAAFALPVGGVLCLSRGGSSGERIEEIARNEFFGNILRSAFFHCRGIVKLLPEEGRRLFSSMLSSLCGNLAKNHLPCALFAALDGDLKQTMKEYFRMRGDAAV